MLGPGLHHAAGDELEGVSRTPPSLGGEDRSSSSTDPQEQACRQARWALQRQLQKPATAHIPQALPCPARLAHCIFEAVTYPILPFLIAAASGRAHGHPAARWPWKLTVHLKPPQQTDSPLVTAGTNLSSGTLKRCL